MHHLQTLVASIPSPGSKQLEIGPLNLRYYGLMIALGVLAAVGLAQKRWSERGGGPDDISAAAVWAVPAGLVGARLYHVITDWSRFEDRPGDIVKVWEGGLGVPGGMLAGILVGVWLIRRRTSRVGDVLDSLAPALPLAQAIGRVGNWFNQELFGGPTDLPWGLEIDQRYRPAEHLAEDTFHPTFLYESLWNLALCGTLILLDRRRIVPRGRLIYVYLFGYATGRLWIEAMRIDFANEILGVRINIWTSLLAMVVGVAVLVRAKLRSEPPAPLPGDFVDAGDAAVGDDVADVAVGDDVADVAVGDDVGDDGVAEGGPESGAPGAEGSIAEGDESGADDGVEPPERAGLSEVPEGGG